MNIPIYTVDAFTDRQFSGNPAGVCLLTGNISDELMQNIAFEMNLAETAFLSKNDDAYNLRWFTPTSEVDLCGHATLASSHILWEKQYEDINTRLKFNTKSGVLTASHTQEGIELDFPLIPEHAVETPKGLVKALGAEPIYTGMTKWNFLVELDSEETVRNVKPDFDALQSLNAWGTIITARSSMKGYDFVSRFFAPEKGIQEDPVTGSAHCALGPYWMKKLGKNTFKAYQASERGGTLVVRVQGDRVYLTGNAVTVIEGVMKV
jgi:PhzF family phenazine biosynthesis protein